MAQVREERKKGRIGKVKQLTLNALEKGEDISYEKLIAFCMVEFGVARRTAREYIDPLIVLGEIPEERLDRAK